MAAAVSAVSQRRCVFVGNIPYDVKEEQIKEICEEIGPVVSWRLVIDRDTGKSKGYGFCEYRDEETALSARRNLQGYNINGRQLKVNFADRNPEQQQQQQQEKEVCGKADEHKQFGAQPVGISVSRAAAAIMAQTLGSAQIGTENSNRIGDQADPLTLYLSKMSKIQLNEIISELKNLSIQNKEKVRELLLACPNLCKAVYQIQLMLGIVPQQMLQIIPNIQHSALSSAPVLPNNKQFNSLPPVSVPGQFPLQSGNQTLPSTTMMIRPQPQQQQGNFSLNQQVHHQHPQQKVEGFQIGSSLLPPAITDNLGIRREVGVEETNHPSKFMRLYDGRRMVVSKTNF